MGPNGRAPRIAGDLARLEPSLIVLGMSSGGHARAGRAVQPVSLVRELTVPAVCVHDREIARPATIPTIGSVLVAVDLSEPVPAAVLQAYGMLRHTGGRVELCYVREHDWDTFGNAVLTPPLTEDERSTCERQLRAMIPPDAEALGIETNVSVLEGANAAEVIRQTAARLSTDVIVIATHDRRGLDRALRGSVTDAVVHATRTATLVVHT